MDKEQSWEEFIQAVSEMAEVMNQNAYQIYLIYEPIVNDLCRRKAPEDEVNHCFDVLLDYAFDGNILSLFKRLGRYYYRFYPDSVLFYVKDCIEIWCEEPEEKNSTDVVDE